MSCRFVRGARSLRLALAFLAGLIVSGATGSLAAVGDVPDPLVGLQIEDAVQAGDTAGALALIDNALGTANDPRFTEDLLARKAEILSSEGRHAEAAEALELQANSIAEREGETSPALLPVLDKAAAERELAGEPEAVVEILSYILDMLPRLGLSAQADAYLARLDAIAASATPQVAASANELAERFRRQREAGSRSIFETDPDKGTTTVRIYYATDRARTGDTDPDNFYGGERGELELGTATVSIPPHHVPGNIERPSIWTLEFSEDPARHVVLRAVTPGEREAVFAEMRSQLAETGSESAFVFVHGFNVPFNEAAQRTAQMAYDMDFDGLPILYSWPSRASVLSYIADTAVVNLSGRRLLTFLEDVVARSGAKRIHLIAHSMGNRALTDALELFALRHEDEPPAFDQVVFAAPDLDAGLFAAMAQTIRGAAQRLTLYASDKDWALAVSRKLHGDAARAGQGGRRILQVAAVDSIDMTSVGEDMLMHSYYANNPSALSDILSLFWRDAPPEDRCGMKQSTGEFGAYWQYVPDECDSSALLSTLSFLRKARVVSLPDAQRFLYRFIPASVAPDERVRLETALAKLFGR